MGKFSEAAQLHRETLEVQTRKLGVGRPDTLVTVNNLACMHMDQGGFSEAARILRETLEARRRLLGAEHPATLVSSDALAGAERAAAIARTGNLVVRVTVVLLVCAVAVGAIMLRRRRR